MKKGKFNLFKMIGLSISVGGSLGYTKEVVHTNDVVMVYSDYEIDFGGYSKYMSSSYRENIKDMLDDLNNCFKLNFNSITQDSVYVREIGNNEFMVVWLMSNGDYFVHVYGNGSNHKGINLYEITKEMVNDYVSKSNENVLNSANNRYAIYINKDGGQVFKDLVQYGYARFQPGLPLLRLLYEPCVGQMIVERGVGFRRPNGDIYSENWYDKNEGQFFKDYPQYKKFLYSVKEKYDFSNFKEIKIAK